MPVNMPTHGHGHGYSDLNFLIPELASGVQFSKGPYFAEHGDFATAGTANINYTNTLAHPIVRVGGGSDAFGRVLLAAAPARGQRHAPRRARARAQRRTVGTARRLAQVQRRSSLQPRRLPQRAVRDAHGLSRDVELDRSDPARAIDDGRIGRFGLVDASDGGESSRYSASFEWQRTQRQRQHEAHAPTASSTTSTSSRTSPTSSTTR